MPRTSPLASALTACAEAAPQPGAPRPPSGERRGGQGARGKLRPEGQGRTGAARKAGYEEGYGEGRARGGECRGERARGRLLSVQRMEGEEGRRKRQGDRNR